MSEASVIENAIPDGWYEDPAKPDMQRWWADNAWTEHVRYAEKKRLRSATLAPLPFADERFAVAVPQPIFDEIPDERPPYEAAPVVEQRPVLAIVEQPRFELPTAPTAVAPQLDDFYVPMARFEPHPLANTQILPQRRWGRAIAIWVIAVAAIGVAAGAALWVFLPR